MQRGTALRGASFYGINNEKNGRRVCQNGHLTTISIELSGGMLLTESVCGQPPRRPCLLFTGILKLINRYLTNKKGHEKLAKSIKDELRELNWFSFVMLTIAGCINAFGITVFLYPVKLYDSGISGLSMLLAQLTPEYLKLSLFLILLNIPVFVFGLKKQESEHL